MGQYLVSAYYGRSYSTLSAADLSKTANLTAAVNNLAQALINALPAYKSKISTARNKTKKFYDPSYLDLYNFCANLQKQSEPAAVKTAAANVQTAIGSYIIARGGAATNSYGVSIWFPSTYNATLMSSYVNNSQFGYDNLWWDFLDTYF